VPFSDVDLLSFVPKKPLITSRQAYQPTMSCVTIIWLFVSGFPFLLEVLFWGWGGCACLTASMNVRRSLLWSCCDKTFLRCHCVNINWCVRLHLAPYAKAAQILCYCYQFLPFDILL